LENERTFSYNIIIIIIIDMWNQLRVVELPGHSVLSAAMFQTWSAEIAYQYITVAETSQYMTVRKVMSHSDQQNGVLLSCEFSSDSGVTEAR